MSSPVFTPTGRPARPFTAPSNARKPRHGRKQATPVAEALATHDAFAQLRAGVARLRSLEEDLGRCLPDYLRTNVAAASANDGTLTLLTPHSALAARLRHLEPRIIGELRERGWSIDAVKIRIRPAAPVATVAPKTARMSPVGLACLESLRSSLEDSPLKDSLARLVSRHKPR